MSRDAYNQSRAYSHSNEDEKEYYPSYYTNGSRYNSESRKQTARTHSAQLSDLHVYKVPPELWRESLNNMLNYVVSDTISIGIIRVPREMRVVELRQEIVRQLNPQNFDPKDYVFLRSVGRSFTQLRSSQEKYLKVKDFLPPIHAPELFVLEMTPEIRDALAAHDSYSQSPLSRRTSPSRGYQSSVRNGYHGGDSGVAGLTPEDYDQLMLKQMEQDERMRGNKYNEADERQRLKDMNAANDIDEERWRIDAEERRKRSEEDLRRRQEEERLQHERDEEEKRRKAEEERREKEEEERRRRNEAAAEEERRRRSEEEERRRKEEEERRRKKSEEDRRRRIEEERLENERKLREEEALQNISGFNYEDSSNVVRESPSNQLYSSAPSTQPQMTSPGIPPAQERETESARQRRREEKNQLLKELEEARRMRQEQEREREELVKRAKALQHKTTNRRNEARDMWKKKYFEEKKKTGPLEESSNRLREELETLHRRLMNTLEGPKEKNLRIGEKVPSQKNNYIIQCTKLQHEIQDLQRRVENAKMKLTAEMKLRNQAESELRALRAELAQKKTSLTETRQNQFALMRMKHAPRDSAEIAVIENQQKREIPYRFSNSQIPRLEVSEM